MPQIGPAEIVVVLLVALLVFGPHKLPEVGRQVGRGLGELRKFQDAVRGELDGVLHGITGDGADEPGSDRAPAIAASSASLGAGESARPSAPTGAAHAPSRFRPAGAARPAEVVEAPAAGGVAARPAPEAPAGPPAPRDPAGHPPVPARAPSRFRAPGPAR